MIKDKLIKCLKDMDHEFEETESGRIHTHFDFDKMLFKAVFEAHEERQMLELHAIYPFQAPSAFESLSMLFNLIHIRNSIAMFASGHASGVILCSTSTILKESNAGEETIHELISRNLSIASFFCPCIAAVALGGCSPWQALDQLRKNDADREEDAFNVSLN